MHAILFGYWLKSREKSRKEYGEYDHKLPNFAHSTKYFQFERIRSFKFLEVDFGGTQGLSRIAPSSESELTWFTILGLKLPWEHIENPLPELEATLNNP